MFIALLVVYGYENKFNQILHEALKIIPSLAVSSEVKLRVHNIMLAFPELPVLNITSGYFDKLHFNRGNIHYKPALEIAKMLLLHYRPDIAAGRRPMIAILFDMNELWEEYIFRKLQRLQSDSIQVHRQQSRHFWQADHLPIPGSVIPDIVIHAGNKVIILDTKWKLVPNLTPADTDLKQMFVYNLYWQCDLSILLYPGNQYKKQKGTYHSFPRPVQLPAHCFLATCSVLDENGKLDEHIGVKILSELCGLT